jgi:urease accessory protein
MNHHSQYIRRVGCAALVWLASFTAMAHTGADAADHHGFVAGLLHPLSGTDHLVAMLAVGFWSALVARKAWPDLLWAPLGFASLLLAGAWAGLAGWQLPLVEPMIAASLLALGLLVALRLRLPGWGAVALAGVFAVCHGAAHGSELANQAQVWSTLLGLMVATLALHAIGVATGWLVRQVDAWLPRAVGAGVALFGVGLFVGLA